MLHRLGSSAARHRWRFVVAWAVVAIAVLAWNKAEGGHTRDVFTIPGSETQEALEILERDFPEASGDSATVVFAVDAGTVRDPRPQAGISKSIAELGKLPDVSSVPDPFGPAGAALISEKGDITFTSVQFSKQAPKLPTDIFERMQTATKPARDAGVRVEYGGAVVDYADAPQGTNSDAIGLAVAVLIILIAFGSVVAMLLPIATALFGLAVGISTVYLIAAAGDVGAAAPVLATMIGLGVGIDYSLFIVTRYRQNLASGMSVEEAIGRAEATAGQAVLFAGCTVIIAICGLAVAGIPYVAVMGFIAAMVVAIMVMAALTLLPALLGIVGHRIDALRVPFLKSPVTPAEPDLEHPTGWTRWAELVSKYRWVAAVVSVIVLLLLAFPYTKMRLGQTDDGTLPSSTTQFQAFHLIEEGFGPGFNGPFLLAVALPTGGGDPSASLDEIVSAARKAHGVQVVSPPVTSPNGKAAEISVIPTTAPDDEETEELVRRLRDEVLPPVAEKTKTEIYLGGATAGFIDVSDRIATRLPLFILLVIGLSFLVLTVAFRSLVVPATAAVMNLLSVGAAYGVVVAVFQWGWAKDLIGLEATVPIVSFVPMMMFAVLFGLSMDYQVFLLTRVREAYARTGDTKQAVEVGLATTARVITSAALIMIAVFLSFVPYPISEIKMFGLGLAVAVFVDATIVRMVLVPSLMTILGRANWYLPRWLDRILPTIHLE